MRIVLLLAAAAILAFALVEGRRDRACAQARDGVFALVPGPRGDPLVEPTLRRLERDCAAAVPLVAAAGVLQAVGRTGPAVRLAAAAARREPADARAWAALARARQAAGDRAGAARAQARARALNPLSAAPRTPAAGAPSTPGAAGAGP